MQIGISPKLIAAVIAAITTYLLGQTILELPPLVTVIGQAILVAAAAYAAPAGAVTGLTASSSDARLTQVAKDQIAKQTGLTLVEVLVVLLIVLFIAFLVGALR